MRALYLYERESYNFQLFLDLCKVLHLPSNPPKPRLEREFGLGPSRFQPAGKSFLLNSYSTSEPHAQYTRAISSTRDTSLGRHAPVVLRIEAFTVAMSCKLNIHCLPVPVHLLNLHYPFENNYKHYRHYVRTASCGLTSP